MSSCGGGGWPKEATSTVSVCSLAITSPQQLCHEPPYGYNNQSQSTVPSQQSQPSQVPRSLMRLHIWPQPNKAFRLLFLCTGEVVSEHSTTKKTREINIHDTARVNHKLFDSWRKLVSGKKRQKHTKKHKNTPPTILHSDKCWENWSLGTTQENAPTIIGCLLVHLSLDEKPPSILYFRKYLLGGHYHYQLPQQIS